MVCKIGVGLLVVAFAFALSFILRRELSIINREAEGLSRNLRYPDPESVNDTTIRTLAQEGIQESDDLSFPLKLSCFWPHVDLEQQMNRTFRPDKQFLYAFKWHEDRCSLPCKFICEKDIYSTEEEQAVVMRKYREASGVIFFYHRIGKEKDQILSYLPQPKPSKQQYVLLNFEAGYQKRKVRFGRKLKQYGMNLLAYLSNDSHIPISYFGAYNVEEYENFQSYLFGKVPERSKDIPSIMWLTSNCQDGDRQKNSSWSDYRRMSIVQSLMDYGLSIASYGRCLNNKNISDVLSDFNMDAIDPEDVSHMWAMVKAKLIGLHKFVISFENEDVPFYVTEKFYQPFFHRSVPIYFGAPNLWPRYELFPHSFIHVRDFNTLEELVEYIKLLENNDDLYQEFHAWRKYYKYSNSLRTAHSRSVWKAPCRICETVFERQFNNR